MRSSANTFDVHVKSVTGIRNDDDPVTLTRNEIWVIVATDELDAWREAEQHILDKSWWIPENERKFGWIEHENVEVV